MLCSLLVLLCTIYTLSVVFPLLIKHTGLYSLLLNVDRMYRSLYVVFSMTKCAKPLGHLATSSTKSSRSTNQNAPFNGLGIKYH